jgi:hypothetical protein
MWHIDRMRRAIEIWEMINSNDLTGLKRYITCCPQAENVRGSKAPKWIYDSHPDFRGVATREATTAPGRFSQTIDPVLDLFTPGDVLMPASFLLQRWINEHLREHTAPQLLYELKTGKRVLRIVPVNLLGAMWFQFAQAVDSHREYRTCKECGKWFEIGTKGYGKNINRVFCTDKCKSKDYRKRKDEAVRLRSAGKNVAAIAKELGTSVDKIKKWTTKRKG